MGRERLDRRGFASWNRTISPPLARPIWPAPFGYRQVPLSRKER